MFKIFFKRKKKKKESQFQKGYLGGAVKVFSEKYYLNEAN